MRVPLLAGPDVRSGGSGGIEAGDILAANYGTSKILLATNPSGSGSSQAQPFYDGAEAGLEGATGVALTPAPHHHVWAHAHTGRPPVHGG